MMGKKLERIKKISVNIFLGGWGEEGGMVSQRAPKHTTCKSNDWFPYETQHWVELVNPFLPVVIL